MNNFIPHDLEKRLHHRFNNARVIRVNQRQAYCRVNGEEARQEIIDFPGKDVDNIADPMSLQSLPKNIGKAWQLLWLTLKKSSGSLKKPMLKNIRNKNPRFTRENRG